MGPDCLVASEPQQTTSDLAYFFQKGSYCRTYCKTQISRRRHDFVPNICDPKTIRCLLIANQKVSKELLRRSGRRNNSSLNARDRFCCLLANNPKECSRRLQASKDTAATASRSFDTSRKWKTIVNKYGF